MWMLGQGGMSNHNVLRAGTIWGAELLGLDRDIGSIANGKLADLLVLDRNPLVNIKNSTSIKYVLINGRIFDAASMAQAGNHPAQATRAFWEEGQITVAEDESIVDDDVTTIPH